MAPLTFPPPTFPQELIDRIIDVHWCAEDEQKTYSLVYKSWLERARRHLFRSIFVTAAEDGRYFSIMSSFSSFIRVSEGGPTISLSVTQLYIAQGTLTLDTLVPVIAQLHRLRCLGLGSIKIESSDVPATYSSLSIGGLDFL